VTLTVRLAAPFASPVFSVETTHFAIQSDRVLLTERMA